MRTSGVLIGLLLFAVHPPPILAAQTGLEAGIGYDYLSQAYFLDSAVQQGPDSVFVDWKLRSTYLNDFKGWLTGNWRPFQSGILDLTSGYEQSADFMHLKMSATLLHRSGKGKIDISGDLDWRDCIGPVDEFGDSYLLGSTRGKLTYSLSRSISALAQLYAENVDFRTASENAYDYYRITARLGLQKDFENFSFADLKMFWSTRQTPDSAYLDFVSLGVDGSFFGELPIGNLDLTVRWETKDYQSPDDKDDHWLFELWARNKTRLYTSWFLHQELDLEAVQYHAGNLFLDDYLRLRLALLGGREIGQLSIAAGPTLELLSAASGASIAGESYLEAGLRVDLDYLNTSLIYGSVESTTGHRNLDWESDLQSDFIFERTDLIGSVRISKSLSLDILFSAEWEWHPQKQDNSELFLLSSGLRYSF